jgi:hypothetical protein
MKQLLNLRSICTSLVARLLFLSLQMVQMVIFA